MIPTLQLGQVGRARYSTILPVVVPDTAAIREGLRSKIAAWFPLDGALADVARTGQAFAGSPSYTTGPNGQGQALAAASATPLTTGSRLGFNAYHTVDRWAFGGRFWPTTGVAPIFSVSTFNVGSSAQGGYVSLGINSGTGKWEVKHSLGSGGVVTLASTSNANFGGESLVVAECDGSVLRLWINGVLDATSAALTPGPISGTAASDAFTIGTVAGADNYIRCADLFWAHDNLVSDEHLYLWNGGARRYYADFSSQAYETTFDAFMASLVAGSTDAIYKLNESSGTSAANSVSGGLAAATLTNGAAFINTLDPPAGFSAADYVADCDGSNDYIDLPDVNTASGTKAITFGTWVYRDAFTSLGYLFNLATGTTNQNGRVIAQGTATAGLYFHVRNSTGNVLAEASVASAGVANSTWMFVAQSYEDTGRVMRGIKNGICVGGAVASSSPAAVNITANSIGANGNTGSRCDAKFSRAFLFRGTLTLPQLTKLYDLGMGAA